ncbi:MAG: hypothetical protein SV775_09270 [Thermodesulfobacteriota bacterium]|nr:hypothetical protein [Thermodesulfobacteriota bacterium]
MSGFFRVFEDLRPGDILLDPFCGGGTSIISALSRSARVIAGDLNPMAIFLSKVLIQPISTLALKEAFESIRNNVADNIMKNYIVRCPVCKKEISFDYLKWNRQERVQMPEAAKIKCIYCGLDELTPLPKGEIKRQKDFSGIRPRFWFPQNSIRTRQKTGGVAFFHELFTGRNLSALAELLHAIEEITSVRCKETLQYVFTATLYSCSSMQAFSEKWPSSSHGWTDPRFYMPRTGQEKNVWKAFENRFNTVLKSKRATNAILKFIQISDSMEEFENSNDNAYLYEGDCLTFPFPERMNITHVFLDPPFNDSVDYSGFAEFWSCWLHMTPDIESVWYPGVKTVEENSERLLNLLLRIRANTTSSCLIVLACGSNKPMALEFLNETISKAGYEILETIPSVRNTFRDENKDSSTTLCLTLRRTSGKHKSEDYILTEIDVKELQFLVRVAAFLRPEISNPKRIVELAVSLVKPHLRIPLRNLDKSLIRLWTSDRELNRKSYNRLAFVFIKLILSQDGFTVISANPSSFDDLDINGYDEPDVFPIPEGLARKADFVAENGQGSVMLFCFYSRSQEDKLRCISQRVCEHDNDRFRHICCLVIPNQKELTRCRQAKWAGNWPRGLFIGFTSLVEKAIEIDATRFGHITTEPLRSDCDFRSQNKVQHFRAKVLERVPVGEDGDPKNFLLRFEASQLEHIVPGQFVMIDTLPYNKRKRNDMRRHIPFLDKSENNLRHGHRIDLSPISFLKRPFSIHRAYYSHFCLNYLKYMHLPPALATITHTVFPHQFEIFYKLIENGTGTNELKRMTRGTTFQMMGPLGRRPDLAKWRSDGVEEVHLVGGGAGMAPLIFFGQALKYYSFRIQAFIGIDRIDSLLFEAPLAANSTEDHAGQARAYIDDLRSIGLGDDDIHLSVEKAVRYGSADLGLSGRNYFQGLVTEQYDGFLGESNKTNGLLVLGCGPEPMLKALKGVTSRERIPMKVLLEKRMGCGTGVCMSCVCRTKKNNEEQYSRVCTEGPLFDAEEIDWERI